MWVGVYNRLHSYGIPRPLAIVGSVLAVGILLTVPVAAGTMVLSGNIPEEYPSRLAALWSWPRALGLGPAKGAWKWLAGVYSVVCTLKASTAVYWWIRGKLARPPALLRRLGRWPIPLPGGDLLREQKAFPARWLLRLPGNESLRLELTDLAVELPRLPPQLDRLRLVHLSDLHLSGRIPRRYFEHVIDVVNELEPDFVLLTGDIVENSAGLRWVEPLFARIRAEYGCYYVLGNHDKRPGAHQVRRALEAAGLVDVGGQALEVPIPSVRWAEPFCEQRFSGWACAAAASEGSLALRKASPGQVPAGRTEKSASQESLALSGVSPAPPTIGKNSSGASQQLLATTPPVPLKIFPPEASFTDSRGVFGQAGRSSRRSGLAWYVMPQVVLVGNERPWWKKLPRLAELNGRRESAVVIALAHTPDQIDWARREGVDLLVAGHLHGGQIRLPGIGPIVSPSKYGTRLNSGLFYSPPTMLYVNRGLSACLPLRWNAPPEVACLTLRASRAANPHELHLESRTR